MTELRVRFADHFRIRRSEWMLSAAMVAVGAAYLLIEGLFRTPYFSTMAAIGTQEQWGACVAGLGLVRLIMLAANGGWRISPYFRAIGAIGGAMLWMLLLVSAMSSDRPVQSVGLWLVFCGFDLWAALDAGGDIRVGKEKREARLRQESANDATR